MTSSSYRSSDRRTSRRYEEDGDRHHRHRSRSADRCHRSRRSRSDSRDRYRRNRSASRSPRGRSHHRKSSTAPNASRSRIRVDSPEPSRCLGVFGLSVYTTEPYLNDIFCHFGTVEKSVVIYDAKTRLSRGFGFVYFKSQAEASIARANCNGLQIHGRRIRVDYSITDQPHPPTPGVYMGRSQYSHSPSPRNRSHHEEHRRRRRSRSYSRSSYESH